MAAASCQPWKNLQICQVEDAGTMWVREVPSQACSKELLQFLEMEKQMNQYFKNKQLQDSQHASFITVGNPVVVCYKGCWVRGKVEKIAQGKGQKTSIFLLDYGLTYKADLKAIIPINQGEWTSVPCQAKKIVLYGVVPVSLQYTLVNQDIKLVLKQCKQWDASATEYVKLLSHKMSQAEFTPVKFSQEGCLSGKLMISLPQGTWNPVIPKESQSKLVQIEDSHMAIDLAQLLLDCEFAQLWKEEEEEQNNLSSTDCGNTHVTTRYMSVSSEATPSLSSSNSIRNVEVDTEPANETPVSLSTKFSLSVTETTPSNHGTEVDPEKQTETASIEGIQSYTSNSDTQGLHTRTDTEETSQLKLNNDCSNLSYTEVTSPLLRRLSSKHATLAKDKVFSILRSKPKSHSLASCIGDLSTSSKEKENMIMPQDQCVSYERTNVAVIESGCSKNNLMSDVSINREKKYSNPEQAVEDKDMKASSLQDRHEGAKDSLRSTQRLGLSNIPCWVSISLVGAMHHDSEHKGQKQENICKHDIHMSEKDCSEINGESLYSKNVNSDKSKNTEERKEMVASLREKNELENTESMISSTCTKKAQLISHKFFMTDSHDLQASYGTPDLDEVYIVKQDSLPSIPNNIKTYRVFVAGESPISEEEVMVNKDIMSATLNSHIFSLLNGKGIKATRLQAYTWPTIIRGCSAVIVGEKSCGKTMGYVVPLLSTILDTYQYISGRLPPGIGPLMVVVCSSWQSVQHGAEYVVNLLPADSTLKVMTAWGGCGSEEEVNTGKQLLGGCDILFTTAPCLMRSLTGNSTPWSEGCEGATTTLTRCCHLVVDDADVVLKNFSLEVKQIITMWGDERKKCARADLEVQAVLVSSKWTKLLSQLTHVLLPLLDPIVIISAPCEAAIATKVKSHFRLVSDETEALSLVMKHIAASYSQKKNMVFVSSDSVADKLSSMMKNVAIYCLVVDSTVYKGKLQQLVDEWHVMQGVTMIVSEQAEKILLHHDVSDAHIIFHTHIGLSLSSFTQRYGFMVDNFVTDVEQKSVNCESYVIVPKFSLERTPKVWSELNRICDNVPREVKVHSLSTQNEGMPRNNSVLCYYLKTYGSCGDESTCRFRHEVYFCDTAHNIPKTGKVAFEVMNVINASRYLVRLTEYQEKSDGQKIDLSNHYHMLKSALQQHYADSANHEPLQYAEKGMLCALEDSGVWSRAQVVSVNYSKATCLLDVFLIDEGKEITIRLSSAWVLPSHLAIIPQLIIEVFLCCIQPWDQDREWTPQASKFVREVFAKNKKSRFVGTVVLALGYTMWLNPLVEFFKIGKTYARKKSLRGKLLTERFGMDNPSHIQNLKQLCSLAGVSLRHEDVCSLVWLETRNEALRKISIAGDNEDLSSDTLTNGEIEMDETISQSNKEECSNDVFHHGDDGARSLHPYSGAGKEHQPSTSPENAHATLHLSYEQLPLNTEMIVEVTELMSPEEFYVIREDRLQELDDLEGEIDNLHDYLESCENKKKSCDKSLRSKPSAGTPCIAKFTDDKYYRGEIKAGEDDGSMTVFFVDRGDTNKVPEQQVHACPGVWVEYMPGQAIRCTLAHVTIPPHLSQAATQAMMHLTDITESWKIKALEVREDDDGLLYVVELTDDAFDPPLEMWKYLVHQGLALMDTEIVSDDGDEAVCLFNASDIDDQEIAEFLFGISAIKQHGTEKKNEMEAHLKLNTSAVEMDQKECTLVNSYSLSEANSASDLMQQNSSHISEGSRKVNKDVSTIDKSETKRSMCKSANSVSDINKKYTENEHCSLPLKYEEQDNQKVAKVRKTCNLKGENQDVKRILTSESHIFNMKRLGMPPLSAVNGVTRRLAPQTSWSQKEEIVHITVHLVGVEQYKCRLSSSHLIFMSVLGDKFYVLDEELCCEITIHLCDVSVLGNSVSITLKKAVKGEWISLFKDRLHRPWLRGDYQNLSSGEDSSETEDYDDERWREVINSNKELLRGGLPAGISDMEGTSDTDASENSDSGKLI